MADIENHMVDDQDEFNKRGLGYIDQSSVWSEEQTDSYMEEV